MLVKIEQPGEDCQREVSLGFSGLLHRSSAHLVSLVVPCCDSLSAQPESTRQSLENIFKDCGVFFEPRERPSGSHVYSAIHHNVTIEKPRSAPHFS
jgi:hypothetical protein